jgi:hypothetical protein
MQLPSSAAYFPAKRSHSSHISLGFSLSSFYFLLFSMSQQIWMTPSFYLAVMLVLSKSSVVGLLLQGLFSFKLVEFSN